MRDSGLFHSFQTIETRSQLEAHPKLGASWEGFVVEQVVQALELPEERFFFWGTHAGADLDLFWQSGGKNYGLEVKYADAPRASRSMRAALKDLELEKLFVVYPGDTSYDLDSKIRVLAMKEVGGVTG